MKQILLALFVFGITSAKAQPYLSMEAGNRMGINAGMIYKNVAIKGGALIPYTRRTDISNLTYIASGYKFGGEVTVTPLLGVAHFHVSDVNKTVLMKSLEIGHDFTAISGINGNYYLFITHAYRIFLGAGLKFYIQ